ncbi:hypothetical protein [Nocardioides sp. NPDC006303]|uniref:hypothetical protein n=1 Tax=Nocardioides sp. NPDC006303 TaxID=3156747 RepID=UPI0033B21868
MREIRNGSVAATRHLGDKGAADQVATLDHATLRLVSAATIASGRTYAGLGQTLSDLSVVLQALPTADAQAIARALLGVESS